MLRMINIYHRFSTETLKATHTNGNLQLVSAKPSSERRYDPLKKRRYDPLKKRRYDPLKNAGMIR